MTTARIELPPKLVPVFQGEARYRGAYGGRGSGKTRTFALMSAVHGYRCGMAGEAGQILCAREHLNSLDRSSLEEVKAAIRSVPWLADYYEVGEKFIRSKDGRIRYVFAGLRHNIDSLKSKARLLLCWVDEAEAVSEIAWRKLVPTVREEGSEIWVTWNPEHKHSATHRRFRENPPEDAKIVPVQWYDNPWFPSVLDRERLEDREKRPDQYAHIWEGDFATSFEGAYYALALADAERDERITDLRPDPLMETRAYWDIGGTGARSDATAIWVAQFVGTTIKVVDYYEAVGQPLIAHVNWLKDRGYSRAVCVLPHDGGNAEKVYATTYQGALNDAGFSTIVVKNQGAGAAMQRVEAGRRCFGSIWFDRVRTEAGRDALAHYHEKRDDKRNIGFGPEHDWSSHAADAFGLMCLAFLNNTTKSDWSKPLKRGLGSIA
ncbi:phage terminase large subunit [Paracoccus sp. DMF-8]|uniref:PBSX family phage terminase large subunit n=1 Tax=Paracoccus sp. DMF-8 TaxID=3019445 RepID=UPI0023E44CE7|nr:phage terminase large subunit [Paracoccus sp. DMF-8]MDF3607545.1 phage terminase large subunit [Paracoccus sp. DMF-8]